jgi:hypothetical protein
MQFVLPARGKSGRKERKGGRERITVQNGRFIVFSRRRVRRRVNFSSDLSPADK